MTAYCLIKSSPGHGFAFCVRPGTLTFNVVGSLHQDQTVRDITSGLIAAGVGCGVATLFLLSVSTAALSYARRREGAKHKQMQSLARREAQGSPNAEADETSPRNEWGMGSPKRGGGTIPPGC